MSNHAHNFIDLAGQKFGRLTVLKIECKSNNNCIKWLCKCECGNYKVVAGKHLKDGSTLSCGCLQKENSRKRLITHGMTNTRIFNIWYHVIDRCTNPHHEAYYRYGGRGINVCDRWLKFENFYEDMKETYKDGLSIDRIDNNKGYYKENCRWATSIEQCNNMSINLIFTYNGLTDTLANLCRTNNKSYNLIYDRISHGFSIERAMTEPKRIRKRNPK